MQSEHVTLICFDNSLSIARLTGKESASGCEISLNMCKQLHQHRGTPYSGLLRCACVQSEQSVAPTVSYQSNAWKQINESAGSVQCNELQYVTTMKITVDYAKVIPFQQNHLNYYLTLEYRITYCCCCLKLQLRRKKYGIQQERIKATAVYQRC
jgi:hypothetical protein